MYRRFKRPLFGEEPSMNEQEIGTFELQTFLPMIILFGVFITTLTHIFRYLLYLRVVFVF